jgi:hypothetical protein
MKPEERNKKGPKAPEIRKPPFTLYLPKREATNLLIAVPSSLYLKFRDGVCQCKEGNYYPITLATQ